MDGERQNFVDKQKTTLEEWLQVHIYIKEIIDSSLKSANDYKKKIIISWKKLKNEQSFYSFQERGIRVGMKQDNNLGFQPIKMLLDIKCAL